MQEVGINGCAIYDEAYMPNQVPFLIEDDLTEKMQVFLQNLESALTISNQPVSFLGSHILKSWKSIQDFWPPKPFLSLLRLRI